MESILSILDFTDAVFMPIACTCFLKLSFLSTVEPRELELALKGNEEQFDLARVRVNGVNSC